MKPRYRICARCRHRWNVSRKAPNSHKYICPVCAQGKRRATSKNMIQKEFYI